MAKQTQPYDKSSLRLPLGKIALNNFVGGIFWAVGVTIGFSLFIAILSLISDYINLIPIVGKFVSEIIDYVLSYNHNLR